jgi:hypothetical protein
MVFFKEDLFSFGKKFEVYFSTGNKGVGLHESFLN